MRFQIITASFVVLLGSFFIDSGTSLPSAGPAVEDLIVVAPEESSVELKQASVKDSVATAARSHARVVPYEVDSGDTLTSIWVKNGADRNGGLRAAEALQKAGFSVNTLRPGETIYLKLTPAGDVTGLRKRLSDGRTLVLKGNSLDGYQSRLIQPKVVETERIVSGTIYSSFSESALEADLPHEIVDELVDLFSGRIEFRKDLQLGDTFTVIYNERKTKQGMALDSGTIRAAAINNGGKMLVAVRHVGKSGTPHYYDEDGNVIGNYFLRYPVQFSRISSVFSGNRFHPILKIWRPHNGVDFSAPIGTPVRSVADGVVIAAERNSSCGNVVRIKHDDRYSTEYLHLSRIGAGIRKGTRVSRGQVIGNVGMTGLATAPHLHFGFYDRGRYVDPLRVKLPTSPEIQDRIPEQYLLATLEALKAEHDTIKVAMQTKRSSKV